MKYVYKIVILSLILTNLFSCDREQGNLDYLENRSNYIGFTTSTSSSFVKENEDNVLHIPISTSKPSTGDTKVNISVNTEESTAVEGVDFQLSNSTISIEEGKIIGDLPIIANYENADILGKKLILNISIPEGSDNKLSNISTHELTIIKFCPLEADFTGNYQLTTLIPGLFGTPTFTDGIITLNNGTNDTDRTFTVAPYPAFGTFPPIEFSFSLVCGEVIVNANQATGVGCGGVSTFIGPSSMHASYDPSDDSQITINFIDDVNGDSCGGNGNIEASILLSKI